MLRSARQQGPDVRQWTDAAHNCTDLLDAAGLAVDCQLAGSVTAVCPDGSSLWSLASAAASAQRHGCASLAPAPAGIREVNVTTSSGHLCALAPHRANIIAALLKPPRRCKQAFADEVAQTPGHLGEAAPGRRHFTFASPCFFTDLLIREAARHDSPFLAVVQGRTRSCSRNFEREPDHRHPYLSWGCFPPGGIRVSYPVHSGRLCRGSCRPAWPTLGTPCGLWGEQAVGTNVLKVRAAGPDLMEVQTSGPNVV